MKTTLKELHRCGGGFDATPSALMNLWGRFPRVGAPRLPARTANPGLMNLVARVAAKISLRTERRTGDVTVPQIKFSGNFKLPDFFCGQSGTEFNSVICWLGK